MAGMTFGTYTRNLQPAWIGDYLNREHVLPGGAMVEPTAFTADADGVRFIPSGTLVGRTYAERSANTGFGPFATGDEEVFLIVHDVTDANLNAEVELYRHGSLVKVNFLPDWATWQADAVTFADQIAAVRDNYDTTEGVQ